MGCVLYQLYTLRSPFAGPGMNYYMLGHKSLELKGVLRCHGLPSVLLSADQEGYILHHNCLLIFGDICRPRHMGCILKLFRS